MAAVPKKAKLVEPVIAEETKLVDSINPFDRTFEDKKKPLVGSISYGLRYLRKKDGSTSLQEGVNDVWTDVPMVIEK